MKKIIFILIILPIINFSQSKFPNDELFFIVKNQPHSLFKTTFELISQTQVIETDNYANITQVGTDYAYVTYSKLGSSGESPGTWSGLDFISSSNVFTECFAFAKYKIKVEDNLNKPYLTHYFYLDYRDCNYTVVPAYWDKPGGVDLWIKYDYSTEKLYYGLEPSTIDNGWTAITDGQSFTIWGLKGVTRDITCFNPQATNLNVTNQNQHPYIAWSHNQIDNGTYTYQVWRLLTQSPKPIGTWNLITTTSSMNYTDNDIWIGNGSWGYAYYKVRAKMDDMYSAYSSTDYISFQGLQKNNKNDKNLDDNILSFNLLPNYPNPFNPSTSITYQLPKKGHVILKVYNTLGKEVAELVNETKEKGTYSITFNGDNLPSGMYFYKIHIGASTGSATESFIDVKKMMLLK